MSDIDDYFGADLASYALEFVEEHHPDSFERFLRAKMAETNPEEPHVPDLPDEEVEEAAVFLRTLYGKTDIGKHIEPWLAEGQTCPTPRRWMLLSAAARQYREEPGMGDLLEEIKAALLGST